MASRVRRAGAARVARGGRPAAGAAQFRAWASCSRGGKPEELAAVAASDAGRMVEVANFLSSIARLADAFVVLDQADAIGKARAGELARARQAPAAIGSDCRRAEDLAAARAAGVHDRRMSLLEAQAS